MRNLRFFLFLFVLSFISNMLATVRQMEYLDRGLIAIKVTSGVYLSWRLLGTEPSNTGFNIYRNKIKINETPLTTSTNYTDALGQLTSSYEVKAVYNGVEDTSSVKAVLPQSTFYRQIKLKRPASGKTLPNKYGSVGKAATGSFPNGQTYSYTPNDCSVADLDGDGEYEIIVKWDPTNSQDNSYYGLTGNVYIDAYKLDGTQLWRIDLGMNIRAGAHYTQFLVYDFDGDGKAELICKTAPGTIDGAGNYVLMNNDNPKADYRNKDTTQISGLQMLGTVLSGPEYLTLFDGLSGKELHTIAYNPPRGSLSTWGDTYGNRADRFLACGAYLDGVRPSAVMCRGYYARTTLWAIDVINNKLVERWLFDSSITGADAAGQGNHNLSVADIDDDGKDEIIYGACAFDDDGKLMYSTGLGHGDAMHVSDMNPDIPGLEVWTVHESTTAAYGHELHSAKDGKIHWGTFTGTDNGRGMAGDIDARYRGFEMWSSAAGTYNCTGTQISTSKPSTNFRIYWDGDLQDELLDGVKITKWTGNGSSTLLTASSYLNSQSCNSTKATPCLSADIFGDWREELILWSRNDSASLVIFCTTTSTNHKLFTLMHDPVYRLGIAWQNAAYNQPPHLGFYIGDGLTDLKMPDIYTPEYGKTNTAVNSVIFQNNIRMYLTNQNELRLISSDIIRNINIYSVSGKIISKFTAINNPEFSCKLPENEYAFIIRTQTDKGYVTGKLIR